MSYNAEWCLWPSPGRIFLVKSRLGLVEVLAGDSWPGYLRARMEKRQKLFFQPNSWTDSYNYSHLWKSACQKASRIHDFEYGMHA